MTLLKHYKSVLNGAKTPYIITQSINHWPALRLWTPEFFQQQFAKQQIKINYNLPSKDTPYLHGLDGREKIILFQNLVSFMNIVDSCYIAQQDLALFAQLHQDYNLDTLIPSSLRHNSVHSYIWIGKNTQSGLHYDYNDNFLIQIFGSKKVFLAPPQDIKHLYPLPQNFTKMQVNPTNLDLLRFPKCRQTTFWTGDIKPGEILFIPKGWLHHLYTPDVSISVNCWYGKPLRYLGLFLSFYRSGSTVWKQFIQDFFVHGMCKRPEKKRLFCSESLGKLAYNKLLSTFTKFN